MFCKKCGIDLKQLDPTEKFCPVCNTPIGPARNIPIGDYERNSKITVVLERGPSNGFGIASLIFGIIGIFVFSPIFVPLAVLFGIIALVKKQLAFGIVGLICAAIGFFTSPILMGWLALMSIGTLITTEAVSEKQKRPPTTYSQPQSRNQPTIQVQPTETSATAAAVSTLTSSSINKADAIAIVNGQYIAKSALTDLENEIAQRGQGQTFPKEKLIEELVQRQLLIQDALQNKLDQSPDIPTQPASIRNTLLTQAALQNHLKNNPVTDAELKAEYDSKVGGVNAIEYKASHILVKTEDEARKLIAELDKGDKFADLANKHSLDAKKLQNGGNLGWFVASQMVAPFSDAVAKLEKGKYSKEPVKTQFGYHIILREDSRTQTPASFDAVKEQLKPVLERKKVQKMVEEMRKKAKVEILVSLIDEKPPAKTNATTTGLFTPSPTKTQTEIAQAPTIPIHKQGDTYTLESINLDSGTRITTERKVIFANSAKLITESRNIESKSGSARKLEFTPEWNLTTIRNIDGSEVNYSPPLKYYDFPLTSGKTWRQTSIATNIKTGEIKEHTLSAVVGDWENVTVPAGTFRGVKVTIQTQLFDRTTGQKSTGTDTSWYVPEVRRSVRSLTSAKSPDGIESKQEVQLIKYDLVK